MDYTIKNDILIICENGLEAKRLKAEIKSYISGCVAVSGFKALEMIKHYPDFSDIFIPLDLEDMDYSDFIKFAKRYSPHSNYILISPPAIPDLGWLIFSKEIDGYIQEPVSATKISKYLNSFNSNDKKKLGGKDFFSRQPSPYFSGTVFSKAQ
ncbi:MAG: response regulator [Nitrospinae bacterium]|nr:response regulator [Nitrospinota bacterium]